MEREGEVLKLNAGSKVSEDYFQARNTYEETWDAFGGWDGTTVTPETTLSFIRAAVTLVQEEIRVPTSERYVTLTIRNTSLVDCVLGDICLDDPKVQEGARRWFRLEKEKQNGYVEHSGQPRLVEEAERRSAACDTALGYLNDPSAVLEEALGNFTIEATHSYNGRR